MELYVSGNNISKLRELFSLKALTCLIVLDLSLNPVVSMDTYRHFVVFHLTSLKALDGRPIVSINLCQCIIIFMCIQEFGEIAGAKEKLGGQ